MPVQLLPAAWPLHVAAQTALPLVGRPLQATTSHVPSSLVPLAEHADAAGQPQSRVAPQPLSSPRPHLPSYWLLLQAKGAHSARLQAPASHLPRRPFLVQSVNCCVESAAVVQVPPVRALHEELRHATLGQLQRRHAAVVLPRLKKPRGHALHVRPPNPAAHTGQVEEVQAARRVERPARRHGRQGSDQAGGVVRRRDAAGAWRQQTAPHLPGKGCTRCHWSSMCRPCTPHTPR
jgi:hypothetical protein